MLRTKSAGLIFLAASSVYLLQANKLAAQVPANSNGGAAAVSVVSDAAPAQGTAATTQPVYEVPAAGAKPAAPPKVTVNDAGTFSIQINNDTNLVELLRMIGNQAQVTIIPGKEVRGTVPAMDLYNVSVPEALDAILQTNDSHWLQKGKFIYVYSKNEWVEIQKATHLTQLQMFHLYYVPASDILALIKPVLSADSVSSVTKAPMSGIGGSSGGAAGGAASSGGSSDTGGNSNAGDEMIVVTDYPENLDKVRKIIKEVDRRPQQILVEATIVEANLNDDNELGMDFSFMGGVNFDTLLSNGIGVSNALSGNVLNTPSSGSGSATPVVQKGYSGVSTGNFDTQVKPGGLQIGVVHNNLGFFLSALESTTDSTILANPKVLVLNKQSGMVHVGQESGYQTTTVTQTTSTQSVSMLDTGTILSFRPFVGDDGYIRMEIHPEDSTGGVTNNLPNKITTEVTTNVMVKDGNTIVIGGLFREDSKSAHNQVPLLGSLPLVGPLFRSKIDTTNRQEIIILLTPHILKDDDAYSKASEEELKDAEKLRVGVRKGMMWFGRERLAETAYEAAVNEMAKPHPDVKKAKWHLDCATNLNPKFLEAIHLKEQITGKEVTDVDNSTIRSFVRRQILADKNLVPTTAPTVLLPSILDHSTQAPIASRSEEPAPIFTPSSATTEPATSFVTTISGSPGATTEPSVKVVAANETPAMTTPATQPSDETPANTVRVITAVPIENDDVIQVGK